MSDASYSDADFADRPLRLAARIADDLSVLSALVQDAVGHAGDVAWMPRRRRLALVLNRFRWEDRDAAERAGRPYERVRSALIFDGVLAARCRGVDPGDRQAAISVLGIGFRPDGDCGGRITLALAGGGEIALDVECIEARLTDLTRPWEARSDRAPDHPLDEATPPRATAAGGARS